MDCFSSRISTKRCWDQIGNSFTRPLGLLELKFDESANYLNGSGQSDIFVSLNVKVDSPEGNEILWNRLLYAWTLLQSIHPLLNATVQDQTIENTSTSKFPSNSVERIFQYTNSQNEAEAIDRSYSSLIVDEFHSDLINTSELRMEKLIKDNVLGTKRVYLSQNNCLARLLVVKDLSGESHMMCLVIAHAISDGLSVIATLKDLFTIISNSTLPTPLTEIQYQSHQQFLSGSSEIPLQHSPLPSAWSLHVSENIILSRLPLSSEELYPTVPVSLSSVSTSISMPPTSITKVRSRWLWAISCVIVNIQNAKYPQSLQMTRKMTFNNTTSSLPITSWPIIRFNQEDTTSLITLSKRNSLSPSMLLYAIISLSLSKQSNYYDGNESIIIGFPYSLRPYLIPVEPVTLDLAIRITFGSIYLPHLPIQIDPQDLTTQVIGYAKMAKSQLVNKLKSDSVTRTTLLTSSFLRTLNRLRTSSGEVSWFDEPRSALNASMIGDLDRILPRKFDIQSSDSQELRKLTLSDMKIGTRLHSGEGRLTEIFTFDSMISISLGFDKTCVEVEQTMQLLSIIEDMGKLLAKFERNRLIDT